MRCRILESNIPKFIQYDVCQRLSHGCENAKFENWVENLLNIPFGKLASPPVSYSESEIKSFLMTTRNKMDEYVYGQHEAKEEVLRLLFQWISSGGLNTFAIALEGPPGIGKTTFAKNVIASCMNRPFNFISLGGATDASNLLGHSYTYEGAIPGRIVECLKKSKVMNPCFYFDELCKISKTPKGDEVSNILVHLTDREQNSMFHDRYFNGIHIDLSQALFVFSYNNPNEINPVLLDRLNVIKFKPPTSEEKINIAELHLIPRALKANGIKDKDLSFSKDCLSYLINNHTDEHGVRNLEKCLNKLISTLSVLLYAPGVIKSISDVKVSKPMICEKSIAEKILRE